MIGLAITLGALINIVILMFFEMQIQADKVKLDDIEKEMIEQASYIAQLERRIIATENKDFVL